eukprot:g2169.t1
MGEVVFRDPSNARNLLKQLCEPSLEISDSLIKSNSASPTLPLDRRRRRADHQENSFQEKKTEKYSFGFGQGNSFLRLGTIKENENSFHSYNKKSEGKTSFRRHTSRFSNLEEWKKSRPTSVKRRGGISMKGYRCEDAKYSASSSTRSIVDKKFRRSGVSSSSQRFGKRPRSWSRRKMGINEYDSVKTGISMSNFMMTQTCSFPGKAKNRKIMRDPNVNDRNSMNNQIIEWDSSDSNEEENNCLQTRLGMTETSQNIVKEDKNDDEKSIHSLSVPKTPGQSEKEEILNRSAGWLQNIDFSDGARTMSSSLGSPTPNKRNSSSRRRSLRCGNGKLGRMLDKIFKRDHSDVAQLSHLLHVTPQYKSSKNSNIDERLEKWRRRRKSITVDVDINGAFMYGAHVLVRGIIVSTTGFCNDMLKLQEGKPIDILLLPITITAISELGDCASFLRSPKKVILRIYSPLCILGMNSTSIPVLTATEICERIQL